MPFLRSTSSQSSKRASLVRIPVLSSSLKNTGICILLSLKSKSEILTGLRSNMVALKKLASSSSVKIWGMRGLFPPLGKEGGTLTLVQ